MTMAAQLAAVRSAARLVAARLLSDAFTGWPASGLQSFRLRSISVGAATDVTHGTWQPGRGTSQFPAKAKRVLQIFCPGGASHIDLWDYKPALAKYHGKPLPGEEGARHVSGQERQPHAEPLAVRPGRPERQDDQHAAAEHGAARRRHRVHPLDAVEDEHARPGLRVHEHGHASSKAFPRAGAWVGYALGSENENLPAYVAIPDIRGEPPNGKANWSNGFLPAQHQAVVMAAQQPIRNLAPPAGVSAGRRTRHARLLATAERRARGAASRPLRAAAPASMPTSWRRGCSFPRRRSPTSPPSRATTASALRHRRCQPAQGRLRAKLPARAAAAGARRALRESLLRVASIGRRRPAELGRPQNAAGRLRSALPDLRSADGRAADRSQAARPAGRNARAVDDRVRPHADASGRRHRPRPQSRTASPAG